jgi:hypothetical protein
VEGESALAGEGASTGHHMAVGWPHPRALLFRPVFKWKRP